jgi:hypothetical protein
MLWCGDDVAVASCGGEAPVANTVADSLVGIGEHALTTRVAVVERVDPQAVARTVAPRGPPTRQPRPGGSGMPVRWVAPRDLAVVVT